MALEINQQIKKALEQSKTALIALRENPSIDGISCALVISHLLKSMGKQTEIVSSGFKSPVYSFLPEEPMINPALSRIKPFVVTLDVTRTKIDELTYDLADGKLNLYLTPKEGAWRKEDLIIKPTSYRHDLIITVECPDLAALGPLFKNEPEFFSSVPVLNIDHDPANERYGHINAVDLTATSCAEIIYPLIKEQKNLNPKICTLLLSGIIGKTKSFKSENVSPRALRYAAELIAEGAARELVVRELYKTRDVPTLRLWGRALSRLKFDNNKKLVWTLLAKDDFMHAGANEDALPEVAHELLSLSQDAQVATILYEQKSGNICVRLVTLANDSALNISQRWQGIGSSREVSFCLTNTDLVSAEREVIEHLKKTLGEPPK
ncbi:hypothetical protein HYT45_02435 [Candidatus Uhrbacteria bacterium]|nr:hypothetical protein [Candidatus Uhrbacteria bacterium]